MKLDLWDRRAFLKGTSSLLLFSPLISLACKRQEPLEKPPDIYLFSPQQYETLKNCIITIIPPDPAFPDPIQVGVPQRIDRFLSREPAEIQRRFRDALLFLEWSPRLSRYMRNFSRLYPHEREEYLTRFSMSRFKVKRMIYQALKGIILFLYMDTPEVWSKIGYDGPWVKGISQ